MDAADKDQGKSSQILKCRGECVSDHSALSNDSCV